MDRSAAAEHPQAARGPGADSPLLPLPLPTAAEDRRLLLSNTVQGRGFREPMELEDRLQGGQFESLPADKGGPGPAKCEPRWLLAAWHRRLCLFCPLLTLPSCCLLQPWRAGWCW